MFRYALIQNESEMLRYGWADIRPLLIDLNYSYDSFTAENIENLIIGLRCNKYDALIIATNACNDNKVLNTLADNKDIINNFLSNGNGIFLSFQMHLTDRRGTGFLPIDYEVSMINRLEPGYDGSLVVRPEAATHTLLTFPHNISADNIERRCLNNEFVKSLYKGYIEVTTPGVYDCIVADNKYGRERGLVLCTRQDITPRIVVSTIVLDWQAHKYFLENCVRHVVEGRPFIAFLDYRNTVDMGYQYLIENISLKKLPHCVYTCDKLNLSEIRSDVHDVYVVDPHWRISDVDPTVLSKALRDTGYGSKFIFFDKMPEGEPVISNVFAVKAENPILAGVIAWIQLQYVDGRWQQSFWATFDVIELFIMLGRSFDQYKDEILARIGIHNIEGSYDEVMGASCALAKIYKWLLGKETQEYKRTIEWIRDHLADASLYERCTALTTLHELGETISASNMEHLRAQLLEGILHHTDELHLYRSGLALLVFGFHEDLKIIAAKLGELQDYNGCWINTSRTASVVLFLLRLQNTSSQSSREVDRMLYRAIIYLKSRYDADSNCWNNDVPTTAKALRAVLEFEQRVSFPVDNVMDSLALERNTRSEIRGLEMAAIANERLRKEIVKQDDDLRITRIRVQRLMKFAGIVTVLGLPFIALLILLVVFIVSTKGSAVLIGLLFNFFNNWSKSLFEIGAPVMFIVIYVVLRTFDVIPKLSINGEWLRQKWRHYSGQEHR